MGKRTYQLFSIKEGRLHYLGEPLTQEFVDETRGVLDKHVASRKERALYERIIFCVASQFLNYERVCGLLESFKEDSDDQLKDPDHVYKHVLAYKPRWEGEDAESRHTPIITFVNKHGIERFANDFTANPFEFREELVKALNAASVVVASSGRAREILCSYGVDSHKCRVLHTSASHLADIAKAPRSSLRLEKF